MAGAESGDDQYCGLGPCQLETLGEGNTYLATPDKSIH